MLIWSITLEKFFFTISARRRVSPPHYYDCVSAASNFLEFVSVSFPTIIIFKKPAQKGATKVQIEIQ